MVANQIKDFFNKLGRPKNPVPSEREWFPEKVQTPNTLLQRLYQEFPFDNGLLTATGRSELEEKEGLDMFEQMSRDPQVVAAYLLKRNAIVSGRWVVEPYSDKPEDIKIADFVRWNLECLLGDTGLGLKPVMTAFLYGRSVCEMIWESIGAGEYAGNYKLCKLKPKNIGAIGFTQDEFNNVISINVTNPVNGSSVDQLSVDPYKVVHYAWNGDFDNPYGKPDLCSVYPWWWAKKTFYKYALVYGDKYASPIPEFNIERKLTPEEEQVLDNSAKNFHISNYFKTPKGVKLTLHQSGGTGGAYYIDAITRLCNSEIARAILAQTLTTNENSKTGTFSQAQVHQDTLHDVLDEVRNEVEMHVVRDQIIKRLVDVNYPLVEGYPRFKFDAFDPDYLGKVADAIGKLCNIQDDFGNRLVDPKEDWVRERAKLPERDKKKFPWLTKMPEWKMPKPTLPGGKPGGKPATKPKPKNESEVEYNPLTDPVMMPLLFPEEDHGTE